MQLASEPPLLARLAIVAVAGATALSMGACSSAKNTSSPEASSQASADGIQASANGKGEVSGLIASVSGNKIQVTQKAGTATVDVKPKTLVLEWTDAQFADVTVGSCVNVIPTAEGASAAGSPVMAKNVQLIELRGDGKCPQSKSSAPGTSGAASPDAAGPLTFMGPVASVEGNIINVTIADDRGAPVPADVMVTEKSHYTKRSPVTPEAITQGKCVTARGTKIDNGTLQATVVNLSFANKGKC